MTRKTILATILLALAGLLGASPYWMGGRAERTYEALLREASAHGPVSFRIRAYDRGWFSSRAQIAVTVRVPAAGDSAVPGAGDRSRALTFDMVQRIDHGPFPVRDWRAGAIGWEPVQAVIHTGLELDPGIMAAFNRHSGGHPPLTMVTVVHLDGASDTRIGIPAFHMPVGADSAWTLAWGGLRGHVRLAGDLSSSTQDVSLSGVSFQGAGGTLEVRDVHLTGHGQRGASGLMHGSVTLQMGSFALANGGAGATQARLQGLSLRSSSGETGGVVAFDMDTHVAHLSIGGAEFGPAEYDFSVRNLDAAALVRFQQALQTLRSRSLPQDQMRANIAEQFHILVPALLHRSPEAEIRRLTFKTPEGAVKGNARVKFDATGYDAAAGGTGWLNHLQGSAFLQIPPVLVRSLLARQAGAQLAAAQRQGSLDETDEQRLKALAELMGQQRMQALASQGLLPCSVSMCGLALRYRDGTLSLNGHVIPLRSVP